jgi:hypothetical protein
MVGQLTVITTSHTASARSASSIDCVAALEAVMQNISCGRTASAVLASLTSYATTKGCGCEASPDEACRGVHQRLRQ